MTDIAVHKAARCLRVEVDDELELVRAGADPEGDDEPERELYGTRLRSLRDAIAVTIDCDAG